MKVNKENTPVNKTTKDDSSDVQRLKQNKATPPPQPTKPEVNQAREEEDAQKGHS
ncbi:hypothetical protein [uncultured Pontibacter sp.]|uniref:hypothetical protein n=1 Tax=uncultured Pontibacter sp. TaxID=453356 RepID=UPI00261B977C|nr:hypothetical protein [uncultured Pontibacter sp.]